MATEKRLAKQEEHEKDASVEISYKKVDSSGKGKKEVREFKFHFSMNILEPLKKLFTNPKFWISLGGTAALGAAASGGWFLGRMDPLIERNPKACAEATAVSQKPVLEKGVEIGVEKITERKVVFRLEGEEDGDKVAFPLETTGISKHAYLGRRDIRVTYCGKENGKFAVSLESSDRN